jgi:hypothetical protein
MYMRMHEYDNRELALSLKKPKKRNGGGEKKQIHMQREIPMADVFTSLAFPLVPPHPMLSYPIPSLAPFSYKPSSFSPTGLKSGHGSYHRPSKFRPGPSSLPRSPR